MQAHKICYYVFMNKETPNIEHESDKQQYRVEFTEDSYQGIVDATRETTYYVGGLLDGKLKKEINFDEDMELVGETYYQYDEAGNLVREVWHHEYSGTWKQVDYTKLKSDDLSFEDIEYVNRPYDDQFIVEVLKENKQSENAS